MIESLSGGLRVRKARGQPQCQSPIGPDEHGGGDEQTARVSSLATSARRIQVKPSHQRNPVLRVPPFAAPGEPCRTRRYDQMPWRNRLADFDLKPLCCRLRTSHDEPAGNGPCPAPPFGTAPAGAAPAWPEGPVAPGIPSGISHGLGPHVRSCRGSVPFPWCGWRNDKPRPAAL